MNGNEPTGLNSTTILDAGLVPIPVAAEALGMDAKRLRGYVWAENERSVREGKSAMESPIGCYATDEVYGWSLKELAKRQEVRP